jgi:hypothetical protein
MIAPALLLAMPTAALATKKVDKIAITPTSEKAAIIIKAKDIPISDSYKTSFRILLRSYDAEQQTLRGGPLGGSVMLEAQARLFTDGYLVADLKPGTYAFQSFSRQDSWILCFNENSLHFTVRPGEVLYLGEMNSEKHVRELERLAISTGRTRTRKSEPINFFDGVSTPDLSPVDDAELVAVAAMVKAKMPKTTVAPKATEFGPARFEPASDPLGVARICGGYHKKWTQPKTDTEPQ